MKILEVTAAEALALVVPGSVPGVLDGAEAISHQTCPECEEGFVEADYCPMCSEPTLHPCEACGGTGGTRSLPLREFLVRAHLVEWMGRGETCGICGGTGANRPDSDCYTNVPDEDKRGCAAKPVRPPYDLYWALKPEHLGGPPEWVACVVIYASVLRVAAGMGPIAGIAKQEDRVGYFHVSPPGFYAGEGYFGEKLPENYALLDIDPVRGPVLRVEVP